MCTVCFPEKPKTKERECERMTEFSDPKCFLRLAEMQDLPISNEIGFSPKCFSRMSNRAIASVGCNARGLSETIALLNEINVFPRNLSSDCFRSATVDCSECLFDCLFASTVAMANPTMPTVPEVQYEELTGEQLAVDVASLSGRTVEEVRNAGVQSSLVALHLTGGVPETRQELIRLATGESCVRPTAFVRVKLIDAALGILPSPVTAPAFATNAEQTASAGMPPTATPPATKSRDIGRNDFPVESLHLMNETLMTHRFSRNGPVNREVSAALSRMDFGKDITKVWQRLDGYVTTDSQTECDKIEMDACEIANRLYDAQVGLAEAVYRREWNDEWAPILSLLIPGTRSGGLSGCRFEHPDEHSNGPMSSLRLRMNSLSINVIRPE